ncbi:hypothetical protein BN7_2871 [Wickerhamomyces ciferrii]|uniref:Class I SAM-dependent methyltransferase n=1 Tax=Wickerhamomyces ciferrii (strain ATCC 14091 / BCRC 22168 / CBS 111 / JCM 3599 / NBRC 0793 / NRRL Y-1031 F-60-10) TaxID=1206466 RepID=K0KQ51_WICCF|nr:uncharacterized protein BN7_2871 [Wickerhamomyces ciferrii]CCH43323.1 hypothetical protein BN7_2871 [Wickerhamomyces ciferrii]
MIFLEMGCGAGLNLMTMQMFKGFKQCIGYDINGDLYRLHYELGTNVSKIADLFRLQHNFSPNKVSYINRQFRIKELYARLKGYPGFIFVHDLNFSKVELQTVDEIYMNRKLKAGSIIVRYHSPPGLKENSTSHDNDLEGIFETYTMDIGSSLGSRSSTLFISIKIS